MTSVRVPEHIASLQPYLPGKPIEEVERELGLKDSIKLASNENPLGPSPLALEAIREALPGIHRYPDGGGYYLREALARACALSIEQVMLGNGSTELVELFARTFLGREGAGLMADQAFIMYRIAVTAVNGNAITVPLRGMRHDLPAMARRVTPDVRIIYIANPNNPTGTCVTSQEMETFLAEIPDDVLVVVDEAYREYVTAPDYPDCTAWLKRGRRIAILRTFSKIYGLAGLRLGYALSTPDVLGAAERVRSPFNTSSLAQAGGIAALRDTGHVARSRDHNARELGFLQAGLIRIGVRFTPSVANFILVDTGRDGDVIFAEMMRSGVIVRPMRAYGMPSCLRVTVGLRPENERLLETLASALSHR